MQAKRKFSQYDVIRLKSLPSRLVSALDSFNLRPARVGDVACIVEVYEAPPGYELECSDDNGITEWLLAFSEDEADFELVTPA
jgi:hypothetical protein